MGGRITKEGASQLLASFEARLRDIRESREETIKKLKIEQTDQLRLDLEKLNKHYGYCYAISKRLKKVLAIISLIDDIKEKNHQTEIFNLFHGNRVENLSKQIFAALERNIA